MDRALVEVLIWDAAELPCCGVAGNYASVTNDNIGTLVDAWKLDVNGTEADHGPINCWDTSAVTLMGGLFSGVHFDFDVNCWDVSNVETFKSTFYNSTFNRPLDNWNIESATFIRLMFALTSEFDQDLSTWNTEKLGSARQMFQDAKAFTGKGLETWDVSKVTDFRHMFNDAEAFNGNLSSWEPSSGQYFASMFSGCTSFIGTDLSGWASHMTEATEIQEMFRGAYNFAGSVAGWQLNKCTDMQQTFYQCYNCDPDVGGWYVGKVENMYKSFRESKLSADLSNWDVGSVTSFWEAFYEVSTLDTDVSNWDVSNVQYFNHNFRKTKVNSDFSNWNTSSAVSMTRMFYLNEEFSGIGLENWDVSRVTDFAYMFGYTTNFDGAGVVNWDVSNAQSTSDGESCGSGRCGMYQMFYSASAFSQDLCQWLPQISDKGDNLPVGWMFTHTSCPVTDDPDLANSSNTTMCYDCAVAAAAYNMNTPEPTPAPTSSPSNEPSSSPSKEASGMPSNAPSSEPSQVPSSSPSKEPSGMSSNAPSMQPSQVPSSSPSKEPSGMPSNAPSMQPSQIPSSSPSKAPSRMPSRPPSRSMQPSQVPTSSPSPAWEEVFLENFDNGLGVFTAGRNNIKVHNKLAHSGDNALMIRDDTPTSYATTGGFHVGTNTKVRLHFWYAGNGVDATNHDSFQVQYSTDGVTFIEWEEFVWTDSLQKKEWYEASLDPIDVGDDEYIFIRFQSFALAKTDKFHIDDVKLEKQ